MSPNAHYVGKICVSYTVGCKSVRYHIILYDTHCVLGLERPFTRGHVELVVGVIDPRLKTWYEAVWPLHYTMPYCLLVWWRMLLNEIM